MLYAREVSILDFGTGTAGACCSLWSEQVHFLGPPLLRGGNGGGVSVGGMMMVVSCASGSTENSGLVMQVHDDFLGRSGRLGVGEGGVSRPKDVLLVTRFNSFLFNLKGGDGGGGGDDDFS